MGLSRRLIIVLVLAPWFRPTVAEAETTLLYDVDFGTPPHTVGQPPVIGNGDAPRKTPTSIPFGDPTVVTTLGGLTDQPCAFGNGTTGYDQLQFRIGGGHVGSFDDQDYYHVEMDVVVERLDSGNFTILCDLPTVHNVIFNPDGQITSFPGGLEATYEFGVPVHLEFEVGLFAPSHWKVWIDGSLVFSVPYTGYEFESLRVNLTGQNASDAAAMDNFRVYGENHVCCLGFDCVITNVSACEDLGGGYFPEWDSCEPVNPCAPTPTRSMGWGGIKSIYR